MTVIPILLLLVGMNSGEIKSYSYQQTKTNITYTEITPKNFLIKPKGIELEIEKKPEAKILGSGEGDKPEIEESSCHCIGCSYIGGYRGLGAGSPNNNKFSRPTRINY